MPNADLLDRAVRSGWRARHRWSICRSWRRARPVTASSSPARTTTTACLLPDGRAHAARVDRNASLASPHVVAYAAALARRARGALSVGVTGIRLDWPEYPPYDFESALFDFNPALTARRCAQQDRTPDASRMTVAALGGRSIRRRGAQRRQTADSRAILRRDEARRRRCDVDGDDGPLAPLYEAKRAAARELIAACRARARRRARARAAGSSRRRFRRRSIASPAFR